MPSYELAKMSKPCSLCGETEAVVQTEAKFPYSADYTIQDAADEAHFTSKSARKAHDAARKPTQTDSRPPMSAYSGNKGFESLLRRLGNFKHGKEHNA